MLFGGKRPREVSPSRVCVEVDNIAIEFWPFSGRNRLKSRELALCVYLAHQRLPTQEIVGHGDKEHDAGDFGKSPYVELAHSVKEPGRSSIPPLTPAACIWLWPRRWPSVDATAPHPARPRAGIVTLPFGLVPGQPHRRIHNSSLLQSSDVLPGRPSGDSGCRPVRLSDSCSSIGAACPASVPAEATATPTMIPLAQSVASSTLQAGRKPPSGIFITVAWGSVVDTRAFVTLGR